MSNLLRKIINTLLLNSPYYFEDGSRISYLVQLDILRYQIGSGKPGILDIGLEYDTETGLMRIQRTRLWRWRGSDVPLNEPSETGPELTEAERADVMRKLSEFVSKHPKKYERL